MMRAEHERRPRHRRGVQSSAPRRPACCRCAAAWARSTRRRWAGRRRCAIVTRRSAIRPMRAASPWCTAAMHRPRPTASGRRSISPPPSGCRCCSSSRTTATAFRCRRSSRLRAATSPAICAPSRARVLDGDGSDPLAAAALMPQAVERVRSARAPLLLRLTVPRLSGHSGQDTQTYKSAQLLAEERARSAAAAARAAGAGGDECGGLAAARGRCAQ